MTRLQFYLINLKIKSQLKLINQYQNTFKERENLMVLKDFLMNEKNDKIHFTFGSYLQFKLGSMDLQKKNVNPQTICKIQQFFDFIISNKLLVLIQDNDERLGVIVKNYKKFFEKISILISQQNKPHIMPNLKIQFSISKNISKTLLSERKQYCEKEQLEQKKLNEINLFQQLKYLMRLLEQIIQEAIQDINDNRNEPYEGIMLQQEIEKIQKKLSNLNLKNKEFSVVNKLKQKLLALSSATLNKRSFQKEAECVLKLILQTEKKASELEVLLIQKENLIQSKNFKKNFDEFIESFKAILILQDEIESVSQPEKLKEIKLQCSYKLSFQCMQKQRLNMQKLKLSSEEFQQLKDVIKLDEFLHDIIIHYPQKLIACHNQYQKYILPELITMKVPEEGLQNNLSKYQGTIEYLIFKLSIIDEQIIQSEKKDLELIQKEFEELLIEEFRSIQLIERIMKMIGDISIDESIKNVANEKFNQSQLIIEI
ncbi:unnamed protein product [Paramecium primaurelia]|uniref:Uncharacterized protein n=1 Tax=Paramecium primaurelia TaxID=5886 RepID=A0A8S1QRR9_PARPR|nr:unnamed protein product [Paramecium primaurelia]